MKPIWREPLIIIGFGGFSKEVFEWVDHERYQVMGFYADNAPANEFYAGFPLFSDLSEFRHMQFVVAVGDPFLRESLYEKACSFGLIPCLPIIHGSVILGRNTNVDRGVIICPGCIITTNVRIERGTIINLACTVGHDSEIGEFSTVSPGCFISGNVKIGKKSYVGTGSAIREKLEIGEGATIGMGSVVVKDVPAGVKVMGNPARQPTMKPVAS